MKLSDVKINDIKIYWPYFLFGIFVVAIIVNIFYIFMAQKTWKGIYTPDSYRKGLEYNKAIQYAKEQYKVGIKINTKIDKRTKDYFFIENYFTDNKGEIILGVDVIYNFKYLPQEGFDFGENRYNVSSSSIDAFFRMKGKWQLNIIAKKDDKIVQDLIEFEIN